ncbi:DOM34 [Candida oxycetoniae]|uniref:Protein DOM34 homolog n=1 Tax=Candida oxycetoniae TaxID=497107 RepID=A0AAI9SY26_9ASCO|nr:DOM34 [Candida oxycetoniae]KAI3404841.2 DOM34 [Candida oxycetoniae]
MKVKNKVKLKDKNVAITLVPEDSEDLWYLYNLIQKGDTVQLLTHRNVKKGNPNQVTKGKAKMEKILVKLRLLVEDIDYVASDSTMRINGKSLLQQEYIPLNSYHTAEVELNKEISIVKESWDEYDMTLLDDLCSIEKKADIGAVVFQEGVAHVCYVTDQMTVLQAKIEKSIPRKNKDYGTRDLDKAMNSFFNMIIQAIIRHFDFEKLKVIILASPGFLANSLYERLIQECTNLQSSGNTKDAKRFNIILTNKHKILVAHCSTGYLQGLEEVLTDSSLSKKLADTKFYEESDVLMKFQKALNDDDGRAWYGLDEIRKALQMDAIRFLMVSDELFQNDDVKTRRMYIDICEQAKSMGAKVYIFSSLHESGIQLNQLTGVAALLKYPVPDLDESDNE